MLEVRPIGKGSASRFSASWGHSGTPLLTLIALLVLAACGSPRASMVTEDGPSKLEGWNGVNNLFQEGRIYFAGQPDAESFGRLAREEGVRTVVNLRHADELSGLSFDEPTTVESLGLEYVSIPVAPASFSAEDVDRFAEVVRRTDGPVLLHCASSNRVGGMWASYLVRHEGIDVENAIAIGKKAGLRSTGMIEAVRRVAGD